MRRVMLIVLLLVASLAESSVFAAGSVSVNGAICGPTRDIGGAWHVCYTLTWTANGSGAVSGNASDIAKIRAGYLVDVAFVPGSGGTQPSDQYDIQFLDANGIDLFGGVGSDLSNASASKALFDPMQFYPANQSVNLVVANAGTSKTGTVKLTIAAARDR